MPDDEYLESIYEEIKKNLNTKYEKEIQLKDDGKFWPMPDINKDRCVWFLAGAANSGKSYLASKILS